MPDVPPEQEPVPVADQKAAGVPPEETVTIADQKAGVPPPDLVQPDSALGQPPSPDPTSDPVQSAANESPVLPANAQAAAAKAHAAVDHCLQVLNATKADLEKYVPAELVSAGQRDVSAFIRSIL